MATLTSAGAMDVHRFRAVNKELHPEVRATNQWLEHVGKNLMGYATWVPSNAKRADDAYEFMSYAGHQRVLSPFVSAPIYFNDDWEHLSKVQEMRMSKDKLDAKRLRREFELGAKVYGDLLGIGREYGLVKADETASTERLKKMILDTEFQGA